LHASSLVSSCSLCVQKQQDEGKKKQWREKDRDNQEGCGSRPLLLTSIFVRECLLWGYNGVTFFPA